MPTNLPIHNARDRVALGLRVPSATLALIRADRDSRSLAAEPEP